MLRPSQSFILEKALELRAKEVPRCFQWNRSTADEDLFFHPTGLTGVWTYWLPSSPGGRCENSPAVDCRVRIGDCISPEGTVESPNVLRQLLLSVQDKGSPENCSTVPSGLWVFASQSHP